MSEPQPCPTCGGIDIWKIAGLLLELERLNTALAEIADWGDAGPDAAAMREIARAAICIPEGEGVMGVTLRGKSD